MYRSKTQFVLKSLPVFNSHVWYEQKNAPLCVNLMMTCYIQLRRIFKVFFIRRVYDPFETILLTVGIRTHLHIQWTLNIVPNVECVMRKEEFIIIYIIILFKGREKIWINRDTFVRPNSWTKYNTSREKKNICFIFALWTDVQQNIPHIKKTLKIPTEATMMVLYL